MNGFWIELDEVMNSGMLSGKGSWKALDDNNKITMYEGKLHGVYFNGLKTYYFKGEQLF